MLVSSTTSKDGSTVTINIPERFDFSIHNEFRQIYRGTNVKNFIIDMRNTLYVDSAALGMLLQLHEHVGSNRSAVKVMNASKNIKEILDIANFDKLLDVQ